MQCKIGFIGAGNMAGAIINGIVSSGLLKPEEIAVNDVRAAQVESYTSRGFAGCDTIAQLVESCAYVVLSVKPQNFPDVLAQIKPAAKPDTVFISIAAGMSAEYIKKALGFDAKVVRVMPNTPLLIGCGAVAISRVDPTSPEEFAFAKSIFAAAGQVEEVDADKMNEVIPLNSSSPAYIYLFAKVFVDRAAELGFDPDCICTGFVLSEEQVELIGDYIRSRKPRMDEIQNVNNGRLVMVDPIMADGGKLYNGIGMERVAAMRKLVSYSDVMVPNMTEAGFLTGICPGRERASAAELRELVDGLHKLSGKSVVITSAQDSETDEHLVCGYDHKSGQYFRVPFIFFPVRVAGSGDIFSTVMTGKLLNGESLEAAVREAVRVLTALIRENQSHLDEYKGILVERYWKLLDENN